MPSVFFDSLPNPDDAQTEKSQSSPEFVLNELASDISRRYNGKIEGTVTSTSEVRDLSSSTLNYTFYLTFLRHDNYVYPLIQAKCLNSDGQYPIELNSHYGPPKSYGIIDNQADFKLAIKKILEEIKTRNLILSMY